MPLSLPPHRDQSSPRPFLPGSLLPGLQAYIVALGSVTLSAAVLKGTAGVDRGSFRLCLLVLEFSEQVLELGADEVASGDLAHGDAQCRDLPGQVLGVGEIAFGSLPIVFELDAVTVGAAVLREQDQWCRVRGLQRQDEGEQREVQRPGVELPG